MVFSPTSGECCFSNFFIQLLVGRFAKVLSGQLPKAPPLPFWGHPVASWRTAQHEIQPETSIYKWLFQVDDSKSLKKEMDDEPTLSSYYNLFFAVPARQNHSLSFVQPTKNALFGIRFFWVGFLFFCV